MPDEEEDAEEQELLELTDSAQALTKSELKSFEKEMGVKLPCGNSTPVERRHARPHLLPFATDAGDNPYVLERATARSAA